MEYVLYMEYKSTAPALSNGIAIIRYMEKHPNCLLENVIQDLEISRATAVRLMQTLCSENIVSRDEKSKKYSLKSNLVPKTQESFRLCLAEEMKKLRDLESVTVEYYIPTHKGMLLQEEIPARNKEVTIIAKEGFVRKWDDELEAVAIAGYYLMGKTPSSNHWYWKQGKKEPLNRNQSMELINHFESRGYAIDMDFNSNGVRRMATCFHSEESGVLSIAQTFNYSSSNDWIKKSEKLLKAGKKLNSLNKKDYAQS